MVLYVLWFNVTNNLRARGVRTDFGFLDQPFGVRIAGSDLSPGSPVRAALLNGVRNTFALTIVGLPLLTLLGVLVGVGRLSTNWLVARLSAFYVELLRNLPPLLLVIFAFQAVVLQLPPARSPITPFGWFVISNLEIYVPGISAASNHSPFMLILAVTALIAAASCGSGAPGSTSEPELPIIAGSGRLAPCFWSVSFPTSPSVALLWSRCPVLTGGWSKAASVAWAPSSPSSELWSSTPRATWPRSFAGSIQAVPKGQTEAASALALSGFQRLRFVVLPQAMRIALPPIINQYLNFVKNTSLAIAVGFAEVTLIAFQAIGNGQPAPQVILILMLRLPHL